MEASHYKNLLDRSSLGNCLTFIPKPQPQPQPQSQQELLGLFLNLQNTVAKQQMLLKAMFQNQGQPKVLANQERPNVLGYSRELVSRERLFNKLYSQSQEVPTRAPVNQNYVRKEEAPTYFNVKGIIPMLGERNEGNMVARRQSSSETAVSVGGIVEKYTVNFDFQGEKELSPNGEELNEWRETFPIRRRNGFKEQRDFESPSGEEDCFKEPRKSNKLIVPKKPPSKAKHLWINYGRKIIEFAINNTSDQLQEKMKMIVGKLSSKKDFEDFFRVTMEEPENERNFKRTLGKLALIFIKTHAETAFEGSKYKEQMIRQKAIVSSLIAKLISGDS